MSVHGIAAGCLRKTLFVASLARSSSICSHIVSGSSTKTSNRVREKKVLRLEEAIRKATYLPARTLGLKDRGVVSPGAYADIVVFDYDVIRMTGDYLHPARAPDGVEHVLVNGKMVFEGKRHTGERPGRVLRHSTPKA